MQITSISKGSSVLLWVKTPRMMTGWFFLNRNFVIYSYIGSLGPSMFHPNAPSRSTTRALQYIGLMGLWPPKRNSTLPHPTTNSGLAKSPTKRVTSSQIGLRIGKINNSFPSTRSLEVCDCFQSWLWCIRATLGSGDFGIESTKLTFGIEKLDNWFLRPRKTNIHLQRGDNLIYYF